MFGEIPPTQINAAAALFIKCSCNTVRPAPGPTIFSFSFFSPFLCIFSLLLRSVLFRSVLFCSGCRQLADSGHKPEERSDTERFLSLPVRQLRLLPPHLLERACGILAVTCPAPASNMQRLALSLSPFWKIALEHPT